MTRSEIDQIIQDTAYQVAQAIKSENSGFAPELKKQLEGIKRQLDNQDEMHRSQSVEISSLREEINSLKSTLDSWKFGSKIAFWSLTGIGAFITWGLSALGLHITFK